MKTVIDWDLCEGNGACAVEAPELFEMDDDDNLVVLDEQPSDALRAKLEAAARACPKRAITFEG
ncbi:ferredoxin [Conexibacter stalactiti]|uniref:Ferredoxin n=1 Tax=Conexibacter stalactiti TaxID=1940611 RepID=A0ABU4HIA0_9ACTN|nr:ferredoxin [Conexibacter stalactiti]MDW5593038.1 ferredoxin [Conexibacter stalactiti]MEC5033679.1 ferredoxin [Conexibacter stalactiti]